MRGRERAGKNSLQANYIFGEGGGLKKKGGGAFLFFPKPIKLIHRCSQALRASVQVLS